MPLGVQDKFTTRIVKFDSVKFSSPTKYITIIEVEDFPRFPSTQVLLGEQIYHFGLVYIRPINPEEYKIKNLIGIKTDDPINFEGEDIIFLKMSEEEIKRNQKKK